MRRLLFVFSFFCFSAALQAGEAIRLRWCLDHFPNFHEFTTSGSKATGPGVDFMQELARRAGVDLEMSTKTPSKRCLKLMESGEADLMMNLVLSPAGQNYMWMYSYAGRFPDAAWQRYNDQRPIPLLASLANFTLVTVRGYGLHPKVRAVVDAMPERQKVLAPSAELALRMVEKGRVDLALLPSELARAAIQKQPELHNLLRKKQLPVAADDTQTVYLGFAKHSPHPQLRERIQESLDSLLQDGSMEHWFGDMMVIRPQSVEY
ncbi:transporter substrate-binding domain-containing protein [Rheinheimera sp.]|uniref:substrate-binding periplasmic protein n=1 Tax=Rheinheimera sp. TaxID=1869214 RepID=UPI00307D183C